VAISPFLAQANKRGVSCRAAAAGVVRGTAQMETVAGPVAGQLVRQWFEHQLRPESTEPSSLAKFLDSSAAPKSLAQR
jgi:hypothetical protein